MRVSLELSWDSFKLSIAFNKPIQLFLKGWLISWFVTRKFSKSKSKLKAAGFSSASLIRSMSSLHSKMGIKRRKSSKQYKTMGFWTSHLPFQLNSIQPHFNSEKTSRALLIHLFYYKRSFCLIKKSYEILILTSLLTMLTWNLNHVNFNFMYKYKYS